jgi:hypothetical protein
MLSEYSLSNGSLIALKYSVAFISKTPKRQKDFQLCELSLLQLAPSSCGKQITLGIGGGAFLSELRVVFAGTEGCTYLALLLEKISLNVASKFLEFICI